MAITKRSRAEIFSEMKSYLQNLTTNQLTDFNTGSVLNSIIDTVAAELENLYNNNYEVYTAIYINTATGTDLDNKASDFGLTRLSAQASTGHLIFGRSFASNQDIVIPIGTLATTATSSVSNATQFETIEYAILPAGGLTIRVAANARIAGADGNVGANGVVVLPSPPSGIDYVTNVVSFSGGYDEETDAQLRARIVAYLNALQRANKDAVEGAAKSLADVVDAFIEENTPIKGFATCWVCDSTGSATNTLLSQVQTVIGAYKPLGTSVIARSPIVYPIDVEMWIKLKSGFAFPTIQATLEANITDWFNAKGIGDDINRSELLSVIQGVNGVSSVDLNTEVLVDDELQTCSVETLSETQITEDKTTVKTDYNCYSVQDVYLTTDTVKIGTDYKVNWERNAIELNNVPIENEYHIPASNYTVNTSYVIDSVFGVYTDTTQTGTNYFLPSGSGTGQLIYLGTSLPTASTPVYITYIESVLGSNTNTSVDIDYTRQYVTVTNSIAAVKGVYAVEDTAKEHDYFFGGSFSHKTIYLGKAFSRTNQDVIVDYWIETSSTGLVPYDDITVESSSVARLNNLTIHEITT